MNRVLPKAAALDWSCVASASDKVDIIVLGLKPYLEARDIQNNLVEQRKKKLIKDTLILTEHPSVITLGKRLNLDNNLSFLQETGIEIIKTDRGGEITLHSPGQLIFYPVFDLRDNKVSISKFIEGFFLVISTVLKEFEINAVCKLKPAGLWVGDSKIASVGLRIDRGVTNHGFALNLSCELEPFSLFPVCGQEGAKITSVLELTKDASILKLLINRLILYFLSSSVDSHKLE